MVSPGIAVITIVVAVRGMGMGERVIRGQVERACKGADSLSKYLLSTCNVPGPVLDTRDADG